MSNSSNSNTRTNRGEARGRMSNLATVSKVLMNYEVLRLRRENESLRL
jgi:hypothetical protein